MTRPQTPVSTKRALGGERRSCANWAAFLVGLPLAAGVVALIQFGPLRNTPAQRYVSHPVESVEVIMFCGALGALRGQVPGYVIRAARLPDGPFAALGRTCGSRE